MCRKESSESPVIHARNTLLKNKNMYAYFGDSFDVSPRIETGTAVEYV